MDGNQLLNRLNLLMIRLCNFVGQQICCHPGENGNHAYLQPILRSSHQRCSVKKVLLEISQKSQENDCVKSLFFNKAAGEEKLIQSCKNLAV